MEHRKRQPRKAKRGQQKTWHVDARGRSARCSQLRTKWENKRKSGGNGSDERYSDQICELRKRGGGGRGGHC
jgi:hypothetical protein